MAGKASRFNLASFLPIGSTEGNGEDLKGNIRQETVIIPVDITQLNIAFSCTWTHSIASYMTEYTFKRGEMGYVTCPQQLITNGAQIVFF
jgi:hypothetical protein